VCHSVLGESELTNGPTTTTAAVDDAKNGHNGNGDDIGSRKARGDVNGDVPAVPAVESDSFCDFIRFEGTVTEPALAVAAAGNKSKHDGEAGGSSHSLLQACTEKYKLLFEALVAAHVLHHDESLSALFINSFVTSSREHDGKRLVDRVELPGLTKNIVEAFSVSCQLLVDFSALPTYSESAVSSPAANSSGEKLMQKLYTVFV